MQESGIGEETTMHRVALPPKLNIQEYPREYARVYLTLSQPVLYLSIPKKDGGHVDTINGDVW